MTKSQPMYATYSFPIYDNRDGICGRSSYTKRVRNVQHAYDHEADSGGDGSDGAWLELINGRPAREALDMDHEFPQPEHLYKLGLEGVPW